MARKPNTEQLIHCNACGEDYSSTYRRCPFCGERVNARSASSDDDYDDGYVFDGQALFDDAEDNNGSTAAPAGGRRLSEPAKRGRFDSTPVANWPRLVTYAISLVIIIAALVIVFTVIYPMMNSTKDPIDPNPGNTPGTSESLPPSDEPTDPVVEPSDEPTDPVVEPTPEAGLTSITLSSYDFTLKEKESYTIKVSYEPSTWDGTLTWTSSDETYATVDANGKVTNVNTTTSLRRVVITVTGGGVTQTCTVYCRGATAVENPPAVNTDPVDPSEQPTGSIGRADLVPGTEGYIVGASGGLRVRSGPGTTYSVLASLVNGNKVTILEESENGWYRISYGTNSTGYIMGEFIEIR